MIKKGQKLNNRFHRSEMHFIDISNVMISKGYKLKHSACRGIFIDSIKKIYKEINKIIPNENKKIDINQIALDSRYQSAIEAYLKEGYATNCESKNEILENIQNFKS